MLIWVLLILQVHSYWYLNLMCTRFQYDTYTLISKRLRRHYLDFSIWYWKGILKLNDKMVIWFFNWLSKELFFNWLLMNYMLKLELYFCVFSKIRPICCYLNKECFHLFYHLLRRVWWYFNEGSLFYKWISLKEWHDMVVMKESKEFIVFDRWVNV